MTCETRSRSAAQSEGDAMSTRTIIPWIGMSDSWGASRCPAASLPTAFQHRRRTIGAVMPLAGSPLGHPGPADRLGDQPRQHVAGRERLGVGGGRSGFTAAVTDQLDHGAHFAPPFGRARLASSSVSIFDRTGRNRSLISVDIGLSVNAETSLAVFTTSSSI